MNSFAFDPLRTLDAACLSHQAACRYVDRGQTSGAGVPQVFVSYARADKRAISRLVSTLRKSGFEPWWDEDIPAGATWEATIERALIEAAAVIVCWSPAAVASENVRSEARVAKSRGRLLQVFIEKCEPPLFFGERQGIDLTDWNGATGDFHIDRLRQALNAILSNDGAAERPAGEARKARRWNLPRWSIVAGIALVLAVLGGWWWVRGASATSQSRVAVAEIDALGSGAIAEAAQGLTDQVRTSLNDAHIPTVSPGDSANLSGPGAGDTLKKLGVGYTVEGTVQPSGKTLVARLHLDDRARHATLWSYQTSASGDDPAALNYDVSHSIAGVISCAYRALGPGGLTDSELLSRYLRVCDLFVNHNDASDSRSTYELLDDLRLIISKAPSFAPAQSDFAKFAAYLAPLLPAEQAARVRAESARAASRALELDPHSADAYVARALLLKPTDWARREAQLRKAVSVDPKWPHGNGFLAMLLNETGRMREGAVYGQRAAAADLQINWKPFGAMMACDAGQFDGPITDLRQQLSNSPNDQEVKWSLRACLLDAHRYADAQPFDAPPTDKFGEFLHAAEQALATQSTGSLQVARQLSSKLPTDASLAPAVVPWSAAIGDLDTAFRFANAFSPGYPLTGTGEFLFTPQTEPMRRDPRFLALMKRYGLTQFWQSTGRWPDFCAGSHLANCKAAVANQRRSQHM